MLELLAPAGSMEALRAAVQNGANAVYLGVGNLNARQSAKNFTPQTLVDAVKYCHVRGVEVHLTLNTLVSDREMKEAAELIRHAAQNNIDAFIVQDLGVVQLCRQIAPHIPIHGSTQMTVHSLPGVQLCAAMGMKRVVLSRELSREEIRYICDQSPIEIEVFVHGALCMCYSGQCYLSAAIGGRSGNRGRCAQPCRQSYGYTHWENKYPLSLKDNCLVGDLASLEAMGVASVNPDAEVYVSVTNSWFDPEGETQAAQALVDLGCDVIAQHCDTPNPQTVAEQNGVWGVGYNSDMSKDAPGAVLTSVMWDWSVYYTQAVQSVIDGTWTGENYFGGMADGLVDIAPLSDLCAEGTQEAVDAARKQITEEGFNVFDGVIETNDGSTVGAEGSTLSDADITGSMNWYFKNVVVK